jgi:hypothetical protein
VHKTPMLIRIGQAVAATAAVLGLVSMVAMAILMIRRGHGLESYRTVWLVEDSWLGFLMFLAVALMALVVAVALRLSVRHRQQRELAELERRYGVLTDADCGSVFRRR